MDDHTVTGRVMAVLEAVGDLADGATLAALTRRTRIPKPTVRRIAADLVARGVLERHGATYQLGARLIEIGARAAAQNRLRQAAAPHLRDIHARTGEIVWVSTFTETSHLLLDSVFGPNRIADMQVPWPTRIRNTRFLTSAAGLVLLADRPELVDEVRPRQLPRPSPHSIITWPALKDAITAAGDGIAAETEQSLRGYSCVAAGLRDPDGRVAGVIGVVGRASSLAAHRLTRPVLAAAADIQRILRD